MLKNKNIVIVGGAGLLGKALSQRVLAQGANVLIVDISEPALQACMEELAPEASKYEVSLFTKETDICDLQSVKSLIEYGHETLQSIDAVVNCAYPRNPQYGRAFFDVEYRDFCENVNLHLGGYFLLMQQFSAYFKTQGAGNIINLSSIYGVVAPEFDVYENQSFTMPVEYAAIKSALIHLTQYTAKLLKGDNIRVNCVSPGGIYDHQPAAFCEAYATQTLNKGMLDVKDVIGTLLFLLSDLSTHINGQNLIVDDGFTL